MSVNLYCLLFEHSLSKFFDYQLGLLLFNLRSMVQGSRVTMYIYMFHKHTVICRNKNLFLFVMYQPCYIAAFVNLVMFFFLLKCIFLIQFCKWCNLTWIIVSFQKILAEARGCGLCVLQADKKVNVTPLSILIFGHVMRHLLSIGY